jgi:hypothetical protein
VRRNELGEHLRNRLRRMTEVGVHAEDDFAAGLTETVEHRLAEPARAGPLDQPHPLFGPRRHQFRRSVLAVVVHEQHFDRHAARGAYRRDPLDQVRNVLHFLVRRDDDCQRAGREPRDEGHYIAPPHGGVAAGGIGPVRIGLHRFTTEPASASSCARGDDAIDAQNM